MLLFSVLMSIHVVIIASVIITGCVIAALVLAKSIVERLIKNEEDEL